MPRTDKLSNYRTTVASDEFGTHVTYVSTRIVSWNRDTITLRTGGWDTVTTRRKMNQASNQFGLGLGVYRDKGETYVRLPGQTWEHCAKGKYHDPRTPLIDGMTFNRSI